MSKKGYVRLKLCFTQDKTEVFDYIREKYSYKNSVYYIKYSGNNRQSVLWLKQKDLMEIKFICRNSGIQLMDEFTLM